MIENQETAPQDAQKKEQNDPRDEAVRSSLGQFLSALSNKMHTAPKAEVGLTENESKVLAAFNAITEETKDEESFSFESLVERAGVPALHVVDTMADLMTLGQIRALPMNGSEASDMLVKVVLNLCTNSQQLQDPETLIILRTHAMRIQMARMVQGLCLGLLQRHPDNARYIVGGENMDAELREKFGAYRWHDHVRDIHRNRDLEIVELKLG